MSLLPAVDSHAHVFDPVRFPLRDTGGHMPAPHECGTPGAIPHGARRARMTHGLLVNPQAGYATDNRCMLDAIAQSGGRLKGVALIDHDVTDRELQALKDGGVVGARFNLLFAHATSIRGEAGKRLLARVRELGWFAQIYFRGDGLLDALPVLRAVADPNRRRPPRRARYRPGHFAARLPGAARARSRTATPR